MKMAPKKQVQYTVIDLYREWLQTHPQDQKVHRIPFSSSEASLPLPPKRSIDSFPDHRVPLSYFELPQTITDYYAKKGIVYLYEWQSRCLLTEGVLEGRNLTYTAPTSGGKTLVAEILLWRRLFHNPFSNRAIVILPYVSLVIEKYRQLHAILQGKRMNGEKIKAGCYYGNKVDLWRWSQE